MATTTLPKKLKKFTAFVDGTGYLGKVEEVESPKLTLKMEEYRAGSMDAPVEIDMGMEKLEATITFAEYSEELFTKFGLVDGADVPLTLRGAIQADSDADAVIIELRGQIRELDPGSWKGGDNTTLKVAVAIRYYKLTIAKNEIVEIDVVNMIRKIKGKDQLESQRKALGF